MLARHWRPCRKIATSSDLTRVCKSDHKTRVTDVLVALAASTGQSLPCETLAVPPSHTSRLIPSPVFRTPASAPDI